MKEIVLSNNKGKAIVDDVDWQFLSKWKWSLSAERHGKVYAMRTVRMYVARGVYRNKTILMHRLILGVTDRLTFVDHEDGNGLHNWRSNLRMATNSQNQAWSVMRSRPSGSVFRGVRLYAGRWQAAITVTGKQRYLGRFDTPELAAAEYDRVALQIFGEFARLNFPTRSLS